MTAPADFGPLAGPDDEAGYRHATACAFDAHPEEIGAWWDKVGHENLRVVRDGGRTVGGLMRLPMGQFFGGRSVPMAGIAAVAIAPEVRGRGVARSLMEATLRELRADGFALSTLYASNAALYRAVGYEQAGLHCVASMRPRDLPRVKSDLALRPATEDDTPAIDALYRESARRRDGFLDRRDYIWMRIRDPRGFVCRGWVVEAPDGALEGYVYLHTTGRIDFERLTVGDWAATTPRALDAVRAFLAGQTTIWKSVTWKSGPYDALIAALPHPLVDLQVTEYWYVRVLDVVRALTERGYAPGRTGEVHFSVSDPLLPENDGRFVLAVEGGRGEVRAGGDGRLALDAHALAPLYTGLVSAEQLALAGRLRGDADTLALATSLFAGRGPVSPDAF